MNWRDFLKLSRKTSFLQPIKTLRLEWRHTALKKFFLLNFPWCNKQFQKRHLQNSFIVLLYYLHKIAIDFPTFITVTKTKCIAIGNVSQKYKNLGILRCVIQRALSTSLILWPLHSSALSKMPFSTQNSRQMAFSVTFCFISLILSKIHKALLNNAKMVMQFW